jgi:hypothetical protein
LEDSERICLDVKRIPSVIEAWLALNVTNVGGSCLIHGVIALQGDLSTVITGTFHSEIKLDLDGHIYKVYLASTYESL